MRSVKLNLWYGLPMIEALPSISVRGLSKSFTKGGPPAVSDLHFEIQQGETVAFLGPNGAGKSTTVKMLCGILTPSSGSARILGHPAGSKSANQALGLVFGTRSQLYLHMTVLQCLDLIAEIYHVTGAAKRNRISALVGLFDIERLVERRVRTLSLGERMACEIVAALIHGPRVLLADEPTIGLDVVAKNRLRMLILKWQKEERTTLMLTSHDLSDVEALCERCILIDQGVKRFDGKLSALKGDLAWLRRIDVTSSIAARPVFSADPRIRTVDSNEAFIHRYELSTREINMSEGLASLSSHYGDGLQDIRISEVSLEEVLHRIYAGGV